MLKKLSASYTFALIGLVVVLGSCKKEYESIQDTDDAKINQYMVTNNLKLTKDPTGFYFGVTEPAATDPVFPIFKSGDSVFYHVNLKSVGSGALYYADAAQGNYGNFVGYTNSLPIYTATASTGIVIEAIRTSLLNVKPGGTLRLLLPSYLGFGKNGSTSLNVPSNDVLDLTITTLPYKSQTDVDKKLISDFIAAKGITNVVDGPAGIKYVVVNPGTGDDITINDGTTVTANYTLRLLDGTVIQSTTDGSFAPLVSGTILAWQKILPLMKKKGTKLRLITPSGQAYGNAGSSTTNSTTGISILTIPKNAVLDFDIELANITN